MRIGIDIGGTFTDTVIAHPNGHTVVHKRLSTPADYAVGILESIGALIKERVLQPKEVVEIVHGTTVATNAILSSAGARTGLITTEGFRDVLEIGRLRAPKLYDWSWEKPTPLVPRDRRLEVTERIARDGTIQIPLDEATLAAAVENLKELNVEAVAVCLLNAYANPEHETAVGRALTSAGFRFITLSHDVLPEIREFERTSTAVTNAYLLPVVGSYLAGLSQRLDAVELNAPLRIMQASAGTTEADVAAARPVQIIESGPAAGAVAAAALGNRIGVLNLIAFDMGGTTAKAALIEDGRVPRAADHEVGGIISLSGRLIGGGGGYPVRVPSVDLAEIGAGGGSLVTLDAGGALRVGPESAGAEPGPACYGRGGSHPTLTDANALLGYLNPGGLAGGSLPLDIVAARKSLADHLESRSSLSVEEIALGAHQVAAAQMVRAVRAVSAERGRDPRRFDLLAFGGSGPLHAVTMARQLGIPRVIVPPAPGLFSAFGLLAAGLQEDRVRMVMAPLNDIDPHQLEKTFTEMTTEMESALPGAESERSADVRYLGQSWELNIPLGGGKGFRPEDLREAFEAEHERTYGHRAPDDPVEVVSIRTRASLPAPDLPTSAEHQKVETGVRMAYFGKETGWLETKIVGRKGLSDTAEDGPIIIEDYDATTLVPVGANVRKDEWENVVVELKGDRG